MDLEDRFLRLYLYFVLAVYALVGLFGVAWISDEFDRIRMTMVAFVTVPAITLFCLLVWNKNHIWKSWPKTFWGLIAVIVLTLSWGHFVLLNAIGGDDQLLVSRSLRAMTFNVQEHRGLFGIIYSYRW